MGDPRLRFVRAHVAWMAGSVVLLAALEAFSLALFYVVSLIGFFLVYEVTVPATVAPRWRRRLTWVAVCWVAGFVALAAWQVGRIVAGVT